MALKGKRRRFVDAYFEHNMNATAAARATGYKKPNKYGPYLVNLGVIKEEIDRRLEKMAMPSREVLARLGEQAGASIGDFIDESGVIDWGAVKAKGHLVKRVTHRKGQIATIELYDAQAALIHLDKAHGGVEGQPIPDVIEIREVVVRMPGDNGTADAVGDE